MRSPLVRRLVVATTALALVSGGALVGVPAHAEVPTGSTDAAVADAQVADPAAGDATAGDAAPADAAPVQDAAPSSASVAVPPVSAEPAAPEDGVDVEVEPSAPVSTSVAPTAEASPSVAAAAPSPEVPSLSVSPTTVTDLDLLDFGVYVTANGLLPAEKATVTLTRSDDSVVPTEVVNDFRTSRVREDGLRYDEYNFSVRSTTQEPGGSTLTLTVAGVTSGIVLTEQISVTTYVYPLKTPVVSTPSAGEQVVGDGATFSGVSYRYVGISLIVLPPGWEHLRRLSSFELSLLDDDELPPAGTYFLTAFDPPVLTDGAGQWSVTVPLAPGDYTVSARAATVDQFSGETDWEGQFSDWSDPTAFSVVAAQDPAAPAVVPVAGGPASPGADSSVAAGTTALAYTGTDSTGTTVAGASGLGLALLGLVLVLVTRRRSRVVADRSA
ncbi:hypothetical protein [Frigoribacterium faeni]|uniref:hypothetical protein n=1 Tax=Frigoribacterium faeni TaxID=145483 RepID=UPI00141B62E6|nr:hypothetical protein [Frigoribacterium faeni]NIJ04470.1 hypothetical protein [Frigoribacterium faeni]